MSSVPHHNPTSSYNPSRLATEGSSSVLADVVAALEAQSNALEPERSSRERKSKRKQVVEEDETDTDTTSRVKNVFTHMDASECVSVMATMKCIVSGFVDRVGEDDEETEDYCK